MLTLLSATSAFAQRPIGDFGRAERGVFHDEMLPAAGGARATLVGEPVSGLNLTDQERQMHDRVWRFLVSPHAQDWFFDVAAELQRTRLAGPLDRHFKTDRYYRWLRETRFASSRVRYNVVAGDVRADLDTLPATFRSICAVTAVDRQRAIAAGGLAGVGERSRDEVAARRAENERLVDWFVRALDYRYRSYAHALDRLLVETPHEEAVAVDGLLGELAVHVDAGQRGEFCAGGDGIRPQDDGALPSRVLLHGRDEILYRK